MALDPVDITWMDAPEGHDYDAAHDYLTLLFDGDRVDKMVARLRAGELKDRKAKDIIRASGLSVLAADNLHVAHNLEKARQGKKLSPVLLVRTGGTLVIADGYHRACAAYYASEDTTVSCVLVSGD
ncbi:MAG: hypothetical protein ACTHOG_00935 [Marmoricola sp.]